MRRRQRTESEGSEENEALQQRLSLSEDHGGQHDDMVTSYIELPAPPDGGYGWVIVFASFMCNLIVDGIAYTFGIFLGDFVRYYGEGKGKTAWVGSLLSGMYLSVGPIVSALCNKFGCRAVCIAGSFLASFAFLISIFSPNVTVLMLTYGVLGGIGFGCIYLPAVVAVGYYFETKRSLATGIAVCGSGVGTFAFAPLATFLLDTYGWKGANMILAGFILNCAVFGALMRPLELVPVEIDENDERRKPLLQRMAEEKRFAMERGSISDSLAGSSTPVTPNPTLPTISESKPIDIPVRVDAAADNTDMASSSPPPMASSLPKHMVTGMPRNASQPAFSTTPGGIPKNGSVPFFDRLRKSSLGSQTGYGKQGSTPPQNTLAVPTRSKTNLSSGNDLRKSLQLRLSNSSFLGNSRNNNTDDVESLALSKSSLAKNSQMLRPLSRKDIFYSGSVANLPEFRLSQRSLTTYRQSVVSLPRMRTGSELDGGGHQMIEDDSGEFPWRFRFLTRMFFAGALSMMDVSLLKDPVFLMIGVSNIFGMLGLYVPFVYLVDAATLTVNTLLMNNLCLVVCGLSVSCTPFCSSYASFVAMSIFFGLAISGYISLTSIILVDLLGLDKLTNAFGLLILFRGAAAIIVFFLVSAAFSFGAEPLRNCLNRSGDADLGSPGSPEDDPALSRAFLDPITEENEHNTVTAKEGALLAQKLQKERVQQIESVL
ncbi:hypothetical protein B566_EDAN008550 [Ephemera danica]|nr:hypothetical protein B566_EDAN008550 [Ephemera danica]